MTELAGTEALGLNTKASSLSPRPHRKRQLQVRAFIAIFAPTFCRHQPHTALCNTTPPKVGVFPQLFTPTSGEVPNTGAITRATYSREPFSVRNGFERASRTLGGHLLYETGNRCSSRRLDFDSRDYQAPYKHLNIRLL